MPQLCHGSIFKVSGEIASVLGRSYQESNMDSSVRKKAFEVVPLFEAKLSITSTTESE